MIDAPDIPDASHVLEAEIVHLLTAIDEQRVTIVADTPWNDVYAGNVTFRLSNGWTVVVFNDCDSWDYLDSMIAPDGRAVQFEDLPEPARHWVPSAAAMQRFIDAPSRP